MKGVEKKVDFEEEKLSKKELRQKEQQEKERQEEIEKARQPAIMDLDDFEKNRGKEEEPADQGIFKKNKKAKPAKPGGKKKIKIGFGKKKKKKQDEEVEIIEDDLDFEEEQ